MPHASLQPHVPLMCLCFVPVLGSYCCPQQYVLLRHVLLWSPGTASAFLELMTSKFKRKCHEPQTLQGWPKKWMAHLSCSTGGQKQTLMFRYTPQIGELFYAHPCHHLSHQPEHTEELTVWIETLISQGSISRRKPQWTIAIFLFRIAIVAVFRRNKMEIEEARATTERQAILEGPWQKIWSPRICPQTHRIEEAHGNLSPDAIASHCPTRGRLRHELKIQ